MSISKKPGAVDFAARVAQAKPTAPSRPVAPPTPLVADASPREQTRALCVIVPASLDRALKLRQAEEARAGGRRRDRSRIVAVAVARLAAGDAASALDAYAASRDRRGAKVKRNYSLPVGVCSWLEAVSAEREADGADCCAMGFIVEAALASYLGLWEGEAHA